MSKIKTNEDYDIIEDSQLISKDQSQKNHYTVIKSVTFALLGLGLSQCDCLGEMSPFFSSFLSAMPYDYCSFAFVFGCVGYFISSPWQIALKYSISAVIIMLFRLVLHKRFSSYDGMAANEIISALGILLSSAVYLYFGNFSFSALMIYFCESVLCFCGTYFFLRFFRTPVFRLGIGKLGAKDSLSLVISLCICLACISGFTVEGLSAGRMAASMLVIFCALYKGTSFGAVTGVCVGAALCINPDYRFLFAAYALGGVVSGVFSAWGQIACTVAFAVGYAICCIMGSNESVMLISVVELGISCACFMMIPSRWLTEMQDFLEKSGIVPDVQVNREVSANLHKAADNIYDVAKIVNDVSDKLDGIINPEVNKIFAYTQQKVCDGCAKKNSCWNKHFDSTAADILTILGIENLATNNVRLQKKCPRFPLLTAHLNESYVQYSKNMAAKMKAKELRQVLTDQFICVGDFLSGIADEVSQSRVIDSSRSTAVRTALVDTGVYVDALSYFINENSTVTIEATVLDRPFEVDHKKMRTVLEFVTKRRFEKADIAVNDIRTTVTFNEKMNYRLSLGAAQQPMKGQKVCGDSFCFVKNENGNEAVIISDGMGTGSRAAIDSTMTVSLMEKLVSGGFTFESAAKIVNSSLIVRSTDESFATVDAVSVNLYTGIASFYKAGAALSFIRRDNSVTIIEKASLPIGIIRNTSISSNYVELEAGDVVLIVSDGVTADDCSWINDELVAWNHGSMDNLASHIVSLAKLRQGNTGGDDLTAVAIKVLKNV